MTPEQIDKMRIKLVSLTEREARAYTRLKRAQTLYQKSFERRLRLAMKLFDLEQQSREMTSKLEGA